LNHIAVEAVPGDPVQVVAVAVAVTVAVAVPRVVP
jgi:hypothetical protein